MIDAILLIQTTVLAINTMFIMYFSYVTMKEVKNGAKRHDR